MDKELDSVLRELADHLGFLGYESELQDGKTSPFVLLKHPRNPNFWLDMFGGAVRCTSLYQLTSDGKSGKSEFLNLLNEMNRQAKVLKFYANDDSLVLEAVFPHDYSKSSFGTFWSIIESDFRLLGDARMASFVE